MRNYLKQGNFQLIYSEKTLGLYYSIDRGYVIIYIYYIEIKCI